MSENPQAAFIFEVMGIIGALEKEKEPAYEPAMRRVVPSGQMAHAVRVPKVRRIAQAWLDEHPDAPFAFVVNLAEALWATGWREERLVAIYLIGLDSSYVASTDLDLLRRWAGEVDNWELIDHLAEVSGRLLQMRPRLLPRVEALATSSNPLLRRLGLVTLIEGAPDLTWQGALKAMLDRLQADP